MQGITLWIIFLIDVNSVNFGKNISQLKTKLNNRIETENLFLPGPILFSYQKGHHFAKVIIFTSMFFS